MGRADASGGEHVAVAGPQGVHRGDDLRLNVAHHPYLLKRDADLGEVAGDVEDVFVPGAARKDLLADDDQSGCDGVVGLRIVGHGKTHLAGTFDHSQPSLPAFAEAQTVLACGSHSRCTLAHFTLSEVITHFLKRDRCRTSNSPAPRRVTPRSSSMAPTPSPACRRPASSLPRRWTCSSTRSGRA